MEDEFSFQSRAFSTSIGDSESAKTVQILIRKPCNPVTSCCQRTPFRKVPKPLLGCKVRGFGGSKSASHLLRQEWPPNGLRSILSWGRESKQFVWLGDSNFELVGSIRFAAPGPGISILHQVAVDALAARVVWVESGKQLKPGWKGNKNWQIFPGDVMSTFHGHHQEQQNNKTCLVK